MECWKKTERIKKRRSRRTNRREKIWRRKSGKEKRKKNKNKEDINVYVVAKLLQVPLPAYQFDLMSYRPQNITLWGVVQFDWLTIDVSEKPVVYSLRVEERTAHCSEIMVLIYQQATRCHILEEQ
jgi:hypothetical protein